MKQSDQSLFAMWELTESEQLSGSILTPEQIALIQNDIAVAAHAQVALQFDPLNPGKFAQQQADLAGQIVALRRVIDRSTETLYYISQQEQQTQQDQPENSHPGHVDLSDIFPKM